MLEEGGEDVGISCRFGGNAKNADRLKTIILILGLTLFLNENC